jgi:hypothetical protein
VEAFVDAVGSELYAIYLAGQSDSLRRIVSSVESRSQSNWAERRESFKKFHGVQLNAARGAKQLQTCIFVRNAIAHRLGRIADSRVTTDLVTELQAIDVEVSGDAVVVNLLALKTCFSIAINFVESVDELVRHA